LCFFLRMRLRRFLISDPMARRTLLGFQRGQNEANSRVRLRLVDHTFNA
jgi:hypothetical protein